MSHEILVINPGSTSTKIGVFADEKLLFDVTLRHSAEELSPYATIADQKDFRKELVLSALRDKNYDAKTFRKEKVKRICALKSHLVWVYTP